MKAIYTIMGLFLIGFLIAGCVQQTKSLNVTGMPNPASVSCVNKGYYLEIREGADGEYGVCKYAGWECEEWALYRGECCLQDSDCACPNGTGRCENTKCICSITEEEKGNATTTKENGSVECQDCCFKDSDCACTNGTARCKENRCICEISIPNPVETLPPKSNKTVGEFLDYGLNWANSEFYAAHPSGEYSIETYRWIIGNVDMKPNEIPIGNTDLERAILFNDERARNIRGFAFRIYTPKDGGRGEGKGIAVFNAQTTLLDRYYINNQLDLNIAFYPFNKNLFDCKILEREYYLAGDGSYITIYLFECEDSGSFVT